MNTLEARSLEGPFASAQISHTDIADFAAECVNLDNELPKTRNGFGLITDAVEMGKEDLGIHRNSASARMAFSCSRRTEARLSASSSLVSSSLGSAWSSATVWGFLKSRL